MILYELIILSYENELVVPFLLLTTKILSSASDVYDFIKLCVTGLVRLENVLTSLRLDILFISLMITGCSLHLINPYLFAVNYMK